MFGCRGEQVHLLCAVEELMPSIGTVVPSPAVLAATIWQSESIFRSIEKQCQDLAQPHSFTIDTNSDQNACQGTMTYLTSISEDGKIWSWLLKFDKSALPSKANLGANLCDHSSANEIIYSTVKPTNVSISATNIGKEPGRPSHNNAATANTCSNRPDFIIKVTSQNFFSLLSSIDNCDD
jgi:WD repeat-containing protein 11